jgi:hypothetical protein
VFKINSLCKEMSMMNPSLSTLTRGILAAAVLSAASTSAQAVFSVTPDPFAAFGGGYTVDLQVSGGGTVSLPGIGDATNFLISSFSLDAGASHDTAAGYVWVYHPTFVAKNGAATVASLPTGTFIVQVDGQHFPTGTLTGVFTEHLLQATFTDGTVTASLNPAAVTPSGTVSIQPAAGFGYNILPPSLTINAQYSIGGGAPISVPSLTDVNGTNNGAATVGGSVPEPATLALLAPGLLAMGARRRRGGVAAVAA